MAGLSDQGNSACGQWQADLTAPTPRTPEGHPDITGLWVADNSRHLANLAADLKEVPFQPWAEKLYNERRAKGGKDDPGRRLRNEKQRLCV